MFTGTSFANTKTGERLEILKINCDVNYTHNAITINNFEEVVATPLKKAFYTISDVSDIGSGYFLANLNGSVVTMRVEYSATYNALYCLVSTATDIEVEKNFFGSFKFI